MASNMSTPASPSIFSSVEENCTQEYLDEYVDNAISNYTCSNKGMLMPFTSEYAWPIWVRALLYLIGLLYSFLGTAIIADTFMCAIEKITSSTRKLKIASSTAPDGYDEIQIKVWNGTVANLTLMALGSSAPEILLSCVGIISGGFKADELGPSTIVGSAAFNLLVITAVCCVSIQSPDIRRIHAIKVFAVTAFFSVFAYVWLILILIVISPNYVDLWEAIVTFLFFPILVILAYIMDKDFCKKKVEDESQVELGFVNKLKFWKKNNYELETPQVNKLLGRMRSKQDGYEVGKTDENTNQDEAGRSAVVSAKGDAAIDSAKMREIIKELRAIHPHLSEEDIARLATAKVMEDQAHSHLWYRINATRAIGGSFKLTPTFDEVLAEIYENLKDREAHHHADPSGVVKDSHFTEDFSEGGTKSVVEFTAARVSVMENDKRVRLGIRRYGKTTDRTLVKIETIEGTAESGKDYVPIKTTMVFEKDETYKYIDVEIIDDNEWEPDEVFFVKMMLDLQDTGASSSLIGKHSIVEVTIVNDDEPGVFEFSKPSLIFKESAGRALIPIERHHGCDGKVTLKWKTEDMTATSGQDYEGGEGELVFEHGETTKTLEITLYDDQEFEKDETFKVDLLDASPAGAKLGRIKKTIVTIVNDDDFNGMVNRLVNMTNMNMDALRVDSQTYGDQFRNALNVNGGDLESASGMDYVMHFLTFGWKLIFALVPPVSIWGGWLAFIIALVMIAGLVVLISDLAQTFGCLVGLKDPVTAITFVALGTSLPDLFASKQAAQTEKTADNSIGNVTGSNSVNVFLGLGLPWMIAAAYWTAKNERFEVPAGDLGFSVILYTIMAVICIGILMLRRYLSFFGKGELGGNFGFKIATAVVLVTMWVVYVILSSLQVYGHITVNF